MAPVPHWAPNSLGQERNLLVPIWQAPIELALRLGLLLELEQRPGLRNEAVCGFRLAPQAFSREAATLKKIQRNSSCNCAPPTLSGCRTFVLPEQQYLSRPGPQASDRRIGVGDRRQGRDTVLHLEPFPVAV